MNETTCPLEPSLLHAIAQNEWTENLQAHLETCPTCADTALVAAFLKTSEAEYSTHPLPDPGRIWRAAKRKDRQAIIDRATLPIRLMTRATFAACAIGVVAGVIWFWPEVSGIASFWVREFHYPQTVPPGETYLLVTVSGLIAMFCAAFGVYETLAN